MPEVANATPFAGAQASIDQQARLLNDLVATEGQYAKDIYKQQAPQAQQMLAQRAAEFAGQPDARKAVYDAFVRDAQAATAQHQNTQERGQQLNQIYMDQAKTAVPALEAENAAFADAQRQQYEAAQAARAQAARGGGGSGRQSTYSQLREQLDAEKQIAIEELGSVPKNQWTPKDAKAIGVQGGAVGYPQVVAQLKLHPGLASIKPKPVLSTTLSNMLKDNVSFDAAWSELSFLLSEDPSLGSPDELKMLLLSNSPLWGLSLGEAADYLGGTRQIGRSYAMPQQGRPGTGARPTTSTAPRNTYKNPNPGGSRPAPTAGRRTNTLGSTGKNPAASSRPKSSPRR